ncbi:MAG: formate dehydrogenase subunit gamma [Rhodospirillales bacterium]|nr:formate dehydrogenase subunit gamma [Rhodospirillales bacterium]MDE2575517.1 formate dehydrogenase subunit gamma [Rhodospirillales bacterium]
MTHYDPWNAERGGEIIAAHAARPGAALPMLHAVQDAFGHIPAAAVPMMAAALNITRAEMHGIVTFYHDFRDAPPGRRVLRLCRAEACQAMGAAAQSEALLRRLGIGWGETTADGALTVEAAYCLGLCACAPAALLDGAPLGRLDAAMLDAALGAPRDPGPAP